MPTKLFFKLSTPVLALFLVTACGTVEEEEPVNEELEEEAPMDIDDYNDGQEPTENEPNDDFGQQLDEGEEVERDIPKNHLEKDEETESDEETRGEN